MTEAPAQWNGVPPEPERDGIYWLRNGGGMLLIYNWSAHRQRWRELDYAVPQALVDIGFTYVGLCLTPAEVEANVSEWREIAWQRLQQLDKLEAEVAERERAAAEPLLAAAQFVLAEGMLGAHSAHWDRQGTHGANCPACKANGEAQQRLQDAVRAELTRRWEGT